MKASEFTAVTDVHLLAENERHRFVQETLRDAGVAAVSMEVRRLDREAKAIDSIRGT